MSTTASASAVGLFAGLAQFVGFDVQTEALDEPGSRGIVLGDFEVVGE